MHLHILAITLFCVWLASCAHNDVVPEQHPILGSWKFILPGSTCFEIYTFRANGTRSYSSNDEAGESAFKISNQPSSVGYYAITDTITKSNGKRDCTGSTSPIGDKATLYVRFHPSHGNEFIMCREESFKACLGPFKRLKDGGS